MIILQTGVPGSGKTSSVVNMLMTDESYTHFTDKDGVKKKRPLFVNGIPELKIEHEELTDEQIKKIIEITLKKCIEIENLRKDIIINVEIVGDDRIKEINNSTRNIDKVTDVLSFPMYEKKDFEEKLEEIYVENNIPTILGDIVIDILQVERQAEEYNTGIIRELSYMTVHSFYHLMGEDHMEEEDKKVMRQKEENVLKELGELCK